MSAIIDNPSEWRPDMDGQDLPQQETAQTEESGWEWAVVEIFGHRRHAGRVREEERFGSKMLRVDVPIDGDPAKGWRTHYYGGAAVFSFSLTDEATVMQANRPYSPPHRLLPRPDAAWVFHGHN